MSNRSTASAPFDEAGADVVLHTSDCVEFRVFRLILTLSSPFFQGMFSLPQPTDVHTDTPSIDVSEDSATLDTLLRFLYPSTNPAPFEGIAHARTVALAASKYVLSAALDKIAHAIEVQFLDQEPLPVYLLACRMGWEPLARAAAQRCLDPATTNDLQDDDDALGFPGAGVAYHRLDTYRKAYGEALEAQLDRMRLFEEEVDEDCEDDDKNKDDEKPGVSYHCLSKWTTRYSEAIRKNMVQCPTKSRLDDLDWLPEADCRRCNVDWIRLIAAARQDVVAQMDDVFSEVELRFEP